MWYNRTMLHKLLYWLLPCLCEERAVRFIFREVLSNGSLFRGQIEMVKLEFNQAVTFTAEPVDRHGNPAQIQAGSAEWSLQIADADGNDVSYEVTLTPNPDNELQATLQSAGFEATGVVTLRADGDPDADEEFIITGTESVIIDAPNAVAFTLTHTDPVDGGAPINS